MKTIFNVLILSLFFLPNLASACCWQIACKKEKNDIRRIEVRIDALNKRIRILEARIGRYISIKDDDLKEWDEKCDDLQCKVDKIRADGSALLQNYLAEQKDCSATCSAYIRLQEMIDRKICYAQRQYDRCEQSRENCKDRHDRKIHRLLDQLNEYKAELAELEKDLKDAKEAYYICYLANNVCNSYC